MPCVSSAWWLSVSVGRGVVVGISACRHAGRRWSIPRAPSRSRGEVHRGRGAGAVRGSAGFRDRQPATRPQEQSGRGSTRPVADRGRAKRDDGRRFGGNACVTSRAPASRALASRLDRRSSRTPGLGTDDHRRARSPRVALFPGAPFGRAVSERIDGIRGRCLPHRRRGGGGWDCRGSVPHPAPRRGILGRRTGCCAPHGRRCTDSTTGQSGRRG